MVFTLWWERWQSPATEGMLQGDVSNRGLSLKSSLPGAEKGLEPDRMGVSCQSLLCHLLLLSCRAASLMSALQASAAHWCYGNNQFGHLGFQESIS